jgi:pSer/pThr/pTyr-binding forkhead associated (FHA) protein
MTVLESAPKRMGSPPSDEGEDEAHDVKDVAKDVPKDVRPAKDPEPSGQGLDARLDRAVSSGEPPVAFLIAVAGDLPGRVYPLGRNTIFVGRSEDADVYIADPSVSGRHARLINGGQGVEIEDLGSTNGTFVNGQRVQRSRLRNGDRVMVGSVEFNFLMDRPVEATVALMPPGQYRSSPAHSPGGALMRMPDPQQHMPPPRMLPPREEEEGATLLDFIQRLVVAYRFLRRYSMLIGTLLLIGLGVGLLSIFVLPPATAAVCEVKLLPRLKSNPVETERGAEEALQLFSGPERAFTNAELVQLTLRQLDGSDPDESRVLSMGGRLKFESLDEPHLFRASYKEGLVPSGRVAPVQFLTAHLQNYLQSEINKALKVFTAEADFLRNQMKSVEKDMSVIASERTQFRQANADRLPEEAIQTHSSRFQLESRRAELQAQVRRLQGELDAERRALASEGPLAQSKFASSQVYRTKLGSVNQRLSEAFARGLAEGHPEVRQLNEEKQRIEALIKDEMHAETTAIDRQSSAGFQALQNRVETLQAQLNAARADLGDTMKSLGEVRHLVGDLPRVEERVKELSHRQEATNKLHTQLFEKLKKAELQLNLERVSAESRYEIVKAPRLEKPGRLKTVGLRCGIGLFAALLVAAFAIAGREGHRIFSQTLENFDNQRPRTWWR